MMVFNRKPPAVGTAMDREELEQLIDRLNKMLPELKNAIFELGQEIRKATTVVQALNKATDKAESIGRKKLSNRKW